MHLIGFLIMGAIVGWLAGKIMSGHGYGIIWDVVLGIVGSVIGGFVFSVLLGVQPTGLVVSVIVPVLRAAVRGGSVPTLRCGVRGTTCSRAEPGLALPGQP